MSTFNAKAYGPGLPTLPSLRRGDMMLHMSYLMSLVSCSQRTRGSQRAGSVQVAEFTNSCGGGSQRGRRTATLVLLVAAILAAGGPSALEARDDDEFTAERLAFIKSLKPGDKVMVGLAKQKNVLGAATLLHYRRMCELVDAADSDGVQQMVDRGVVWLLDGGRSARVIKVGDRWIEIRETDGRKRSMYVHWTWIRKPG